LPAAELAHNLYKQDAQLSQRDRAARCVIVLAKSGRLKLHGRKYFTDIIGLFSTTVI